MPVAKSQESILPRYRVYQDDVIVLGPGKAELLTHVAATGSISEAARLMSMSYNRAWLHIQTMNENFREPLVTSTRGGSKGGGAVLTPTGQRVLELYQQMEQQAQAATARPRAALLKLLK